MEELSLHIIDLVENSLSAGSDFINVLIEEDTNKDFILIIVEDNGRGMGPEEIKNVDDPFYTTKKKKVGVGIPFLKELSQLCEGNFTIESKKGEGTKVSLHLKRSCIDAPPMGDIKNTIFTLIASTEYCDLRFFYKKDGNDFEIDTREIRKILGDIPLSNPEVLRFLKAYIEEKFKKIGGMT